MAELQRQREEFQATHDQELRRIAEEEEESTRRGEEIVRLAKERRAAVSTVEGLAIVDLAKMEKQEEVEKENVLTWKEMNREEREDGKGGGRHVQSHQQRKRRQKRK